MSNPAIMFTMMPAVNISIFKKRLADLNIHKLKGKKGSCAGVPVFIHSCTINSYLYASRG